MKNDQVMAKITYVRIWAYAQKMILFGPYPGQISIFVNKNNLYDNYNGFARFNHL